MPDPYAVLQVARNAEPEVVAAAYRSLARKYHPDKTASAATTKRMQELNAAYAVLRDPAKRKRYDRAHPVNAAPIIRPTEETMMWWGSDDEEEESHWATAYARRRGAPQPIPRRGFWRRHWGCAVYLAFAAFAFWQVVAAVVLKM
ncbi:MAG: J domain-containing protein [Anaerolineales bacterium]|nr:J domain-containing protein [Anaerolineales bacterium]